MVPGATPWIPTRDGNTVLFLNALASISQEIILIEIVCQFLIRVSANVSSFATKSVFIIPLHKNDTNNIAVNLLFLSLAECKNTVMGTEFRGTFFTKTSSGATCQRWDQDTPHESPLNDDPTKLIDLGLQGRVFLRNIYSSSQCLLQAEMHSTEGSNNFEQQRSFIVKCPFPSVVFIWWPHPLFQRTTAETLTTSLMDPGASLLIPTSNGNTVVFQSAWVFPYFVWTPGIRERNRRL